jgi:hypothetical protein
MDMPFIVIVLQSTGDLHMGPVLECFEHTVTYIY